MHLVASLSSKLRNRFSCAVVIDECFTGNGSADQRSNDGDQRRNGGIVERTSEPEPEPVQPRDASLIPSSAAPHQVRSA
jgi:hypothetical protein